MDVPDSSLEQTRRPSCRRWCSKQIMSVGHYGKGPWGQGFASQVSQLGLVLRRTLLDLAEESSGYDLSGSQLRDLPLSPPGRHALPRP